MFGYIKTDRPYLFIKDDTLYKSIYCGVCKSIGSTCGQAARFSLTYDIAFLSAFAHNLVKKDVTIKRQTCIAHPIIKRPVALRDDLTDELAYINVLLAYYKVCDDVYDNGKGKIRRAALKRGWKKAKKALPEIDALIVKRYNELAELEKKKVESVDMVAHPFAMLLSELSAKVFGEYATEKTDKLFYAIGKWIYVADALDDYDKDLKKKNYNVFSVAYKAESAKKLIEKNGEELDFIFCNIFADIDENLNDIKFYFNKDLICNICKRGIKASYADIIKRIING